MNRIMKTLHALALAALVLVPAAASAEKISKHTDSEGFEEWYWTKTVTVKRGQAHTFWIKDLTENTAITFMEVNCDYTYKEEGETYEDSISASESTEIENSKGGFDKYVLLTVDDWDWVHESKSSLSFTVKVEGWGEDAATEDISFTFGHSDGDGDYPGEEEPVVVTPVGAEGNPVSISIADANTVQNPGSKDWEKPSNWDDNGSVYLQTTSLTKGRKYVFGFDGLAEDTVVSMLDADGNELFTDENASDLFDDYGCEGFCWAVVPEKTGACKIVVDDDSNDFTCQYAVYATRTPAQHEGVDYGDDDPYPDDHFGDLAVGETSEAFVPGYLNHPKSGANDEVIDGKLFELSGLVKNTDYVFATEGASVPLLMRLYDSKGMVVVDGQNAENLYVSDSDCNVRLCWTTPANLTANTKYYVGVCEQLEEGAEPSGGEITLSVKEVEVEDIEENLEVVPTTASGSPFDVAGAKPSAENLFSQTSWTHTYVIAARSGVEYHVKSRVADGGSDNGLTLAAKVYLLSGTRQTALATTGDIDPNANSQYLSFTPTANGTVYVEVTVADAADAWGAGKGLDYGPYQVCAVASGDYGVLKVDMKGAPEEQMGWKILSGPGITANKEVFYPAGSSAILAAGTYKVLAQTVKGFATPDKAGFEATVTAGETTVKTYKYNDTFDPADDQPAGKKDKVTYKATSITPKATGVESVRSLWSDDTADWFSFTATAGAYYKFALTQKTGAPEVRVYAVASGVKKVEDEDDLVEITDYVLFTDPTECIQIAAADKGTYYVKVAHQAGSESVDSAYTLVATSANPGVVKFAKTAVSVKDSAGYVDLSVSRSGKEGITRVNYTTAGDQSSAENALYYPTTGTLTWANGETGAKTIRVRIVPQSYGQVGTFQVKLSPVSVDDESFDKENEFPAVISGDTATVTVTATAKAAPGTIQLADCDTPKKPVVDWVAHDGTNYLRFARVGGSDGMVAVKIETADKTAKQGTDYKQTSDTYYWPDGKADTYEFPILLRSSSDDVATKTFTVKLTAVTGKNLAKATLASSTITINIANDRFATTVAAYATALKKTTPSIAIKESKAGSWVVDNNGGMRSTLTTGTLTFTLTGPGVFKYSINGGEQESLVVAYGEKKNNTVVIEAGDTLDWYTWEPLPDNLVTLHQCVKYSYETEGAKVAAGKLPDGLKLAQDKTTKKWSISGTPTKAGYFYVKLTDAKGKETIEEINYNVVAAGTAIGTFSGLAETFDTEDGLRSLASVTLTAAATGKLTAKVMIGGKSYSFSDTGYASFEDDGEQTTVMAEMPLVQKITEKVGTKSTTTTVTNMLICTIVDASETNAVVRMAEPMCEIRFAKLPDATGKAYDDDIWYEGTLCRDNSKVTDWVTEASKFAGYYTVSLVNDGAAEGEPKGNGYITLTFDAKGKVKIAGMLADGTTYSASSISACLVERYGETAIRIPLYACKSPYVFGGWLELVPGEEGALLVSSDAKLTWANDAVTATREGENGFKLTLAPVGGWYDTVTNLQKWFLEYDFSVDLPSWEDDFESLLPSGYETHAFAANPCGQAVDVYGDTVSVVKQSLVKDSATKLYDFASSVNASNVKFTFKRATGILTGTFDLWYEGTNAKTGKFEQKTLSGLKHNGVLLLSRGDDGYLEDDVWTSGFYLVPKAGGTKWTGSYRFDVKATYIGRDWGATPAE